MRKEIAGQLEEFLEKGARRKLHYVYSLDLTVSPRMQRPATLSTHSSPRYGLNPTSLTPLRLLPPGSLPPTASRTTLAFLYRSMPSWHLLVHPLPSEGANVVLKVMNVMAGLQPKGLV